MSKAIKTALITGGNGNLGRLVGERLLNAGASIVKFDIPGSEPDSTVEGETIVTGDVRDQALLESLIIEHKPDAIIHLASLLSGSSEADTVSAWEINATASFHLLRMAHEHKVGMFFFASTLATYGAGVPDPLPEETAQWPDLFYGATKVAVERLGVYYKLKHGMDFRCLRFPLVLSPYAPPTAMTAYPSHAFKAAIAGESSFTFPVNRGTGMSTLFIDDVIKSIIEITAADRARLKQHVYSLHSYFVSAEMVADSIKEKYPEFVCEYEPVDAVEHMLSSLPDVLVDQHARDDWGWQPDFDYARTAATMFELFTRSS